jgi:hypothetical protein
MLPGWWLSPFERAALRPPQGNGDRVRSPPAKFRFNSQTARSSLRATGSRECAPDDRLREAIHLTAEAAWIASSQVLLAMTRWILIQFSKSKYAFAISRHDLPELCCNDLSLQKRGRRESRVRAAPAVSCAKCTKKNAHEHTGSAESIRPSLRNGFTAYSALSPVNGLSCHRRPGKLASQELDASIAASGPHDFAVRLSAVRQWHIRVHRISTRVS